MRVDKRLRPAIDQQSCSGSPVGLVSLVSSRCARLVQQRKSRASRENSRGPGADLALRVCFSRGECSSHLINTSYDEREREKERRKESASFMYYCITTVRVKLQTNLLRVNNMPTVLISAAARGRR